jgi:fructoselysine 6-kinase
MIKLIGVGDNTVDTYIHQGMRYPGGNAVNVAVFAHRYGFPAGYLGWIGDDRNGQLVLTSLQQEGVDISHCRIIEGSNSISMVKLVNGDRVFGKSDPGVTTQFSLNADDYAYIHQFEVVHTSAFSYLENSLIELKKVAHCLSFDFSHKQEPTFLQAVLPYVDVAFLSCPHPPDVVQRLREIHTMGPGLVLITCGVEGSWVYDGQTVYHQGVVPVDVVDTLGAGDAFAARFLVEMASGTLLQQAMKLAAQSASQICAHYGAFGYGEKI